MSDKSETYEKVDDNESEAKPEPEPVADVIEATDDQARLSPVKQTKPSYFVSYMKKAYLIPSDAILTAKFRPIYVEKPDDINSLLNSKSAGHWRNSGLRIRTMVVVHAEIDGASKYALYASVAVEDSAEDADDARTLRFIPPVVTKSVLKELEGLSEEKKERMPELFTHTFEDKQLNPVEAGWGELNHVLVSNKPKQKAAKRKASEAPEEERAPVRAKEDESGSGVTYNPESTVRISDTHHLVPDHFYKDLLAAYFKR